MTWSEFFTSSIGKKLVMALTGLFLITFLIIHVGINACIFANDNGVMFNKAAHFMGSSYVIRIIEIGLFAGFLIHIIQGFVLEAKNLSRRGKGYRINLASKGSKWYSRTMGLFGTLLFFYLIMHISHFWIPSRITGLESTIIDNKEYHNLFGRMVEVFQNPFIVVLYVLGTISLAWHLVHGFQSAFRTIGVHNNRYLSIINILGIAFSIIVPLIFALMPISIHFGWVK
jgi:succinate dehydrogenase / fumarate reductase cytochrome b subunit